MSKEYMFGFDGYEPGEISYVIELLGAMATIAEIQQKFKEFTEGQKTISPKTIQSISIRFAKRIEDSNKKYLKNIDGNPLAHLRIRLDILDKIVKDCVQYKFMKSFRTDSGFATELVPDYPTALNALKQAMTEMHKKEENDNAPSNIDSFPELFIEDGLSA